MFGSKIQLLQKRKDNVRLKFMVAIKLSIYFKRMLHKKYGPKGVMAKIQN
jgi:hypothetical protein